MDLKHLFENTSGFGVLATADGEGKVDAAVYARPHVIGEDRVAFIMADRLSHENLLSNAHAAYLYRIDEAVIGTPYEGVRLFLSRIGEETDPDKIRAWSRRKYGDDEKERFFVTFHVDKVLPLVGSGEEGERSAGLEKVKTLS